jgi:hypothetical protein
MKAIVTTTIYEPTEATIKFCQKKDWTFIIVGDLKTPHDSYRALEKKYPNVIYLSPEDQEKKYKELSDAIGWKSIQRRNIGFVEAYNLGADIIATVDDDNIPYDFWGENLAIGKEVEADFYEPGADIFDPLSVTNCSHLWHRGYPIELLSAKNKIQYKGKIRKKFLVQADLWDGDPDIDAICRLTLKPIVKFDTTNFYCSNKISPFNSQNTFLAREALPFYSVLPHIGRMDDIWGGYILQKFFPGSVVYSQASVYQERNKQDLLVNLEKEIFGYRNSLKLIGNLNDYNNFLPPETLKFWNIYQKHFK